MLFKPRGRTRVKPLAKTPDRDYDPVTHWRRYRSATKHREGQDIQKQEGHNLERRVVAHALLSVQLIQIGFMVGAALCSGRSLCEDLS